MRLAKFSSVTVALVSLVVTVPPVAAKPIAFAGGTTAMVEYGAGTMREAQAFHAPSHRYSVGGGYLRLDSDIDDRSRDIQYLRVNYLAQRWNLESAQANVFVWGGLGRATGSDFANAELAVNAGGQLDYETRRIYSSLRTDFHDGRHFTHRIDTLQLGFAPYEHEYDQIAIWFVAQARTYTGDLYRGTEWAALLRLFKGGTWVEAGATEDGNLQFMLMVNF